MRVVFLFDLFLNLRKTCCAGVGALYLCLLSPSLLTISLQLGTETAVYGEIMYGGAPAC